MGENLGENPRTKKNSRQRESSRLVKRIRKKMFFAVIGIGSPNTLLLNNIQAKPLPASEQRKQTEA
jgi:hypothetical protein